MIKLENLKEVLEQLGFNSKGKIFEKIFPEIDAYLKVDFKNELLIYPEDKGFKINERQTCNFSSNENFIVFECVNRLFEKGYKAEHIELEPKWKVGHGASGGRADILIRDNFKKPLLIIECKTPGKEFDKAWKETRIDGDQLLSYAHQIPDTEFLCLYTCYLVEKNQISFTSNIISHKDNELIIADNRNLKSFDKAKNVRERYSVWKETYQLEFSTRGIFETNIQPYHIGKDKYTIYDIVPIDAKNKEGKYHEFRTILRKHNVSGRERAFDVLVNLFLCKIVDETQNTDDLKFYWKGIAYDSYFELIDRLQLLYKIGMDKFLAQEIVYISNKEIDEAFWAVKQKRNATKQQIKEYFRQLKFYTNSDFGLLDVHNEKLFYQNAKVLLELVLMWQDLRIKTEEHNQFLGDMFEFFLDNGIKQSEGQFFTPLSVCKFILMSLPLEQIIADNTEPPKTIDYACGAGHFLTEYASQITPIVKKLSIKPELFYKEIYGIEKEYRLSKVAKISSFMYGHEGVEILHNDALDTHYKVKDNSFNILVANPPFSVDGFLATLNEEIREKYELTKTIKDISRNGNIECFFIERAKMLLANDGVAGIIIPASILSNADTTHTNTREIILKYFDIISLVELGRNTFSKTPANTIVLFLRRKANKPEPAVHYLNRVDDWFDEDENSEDSEAYKDQYLIKAYCEHIDVDVDDYLTLLNGEPSEALYKNEIFQLYIEEFETSTSVKKIKDKPLSDKYSLQDKELQLKKLLIRTLREKEKNKLYYFIIAFTNTQKVLVVNSPTDLKELKKYRGYDWSGAKGSEGIKYNGGDTVDDIITPLFDPKSRLNKNKLSYFIQQNFTNSEIDENELHEVLPQASLIELKDLIRFRSKNFDKRIWLSTEKTLSIKSKWKLKTLQSICTIVRGASPRPISKFITDKTDGVSWIKIGDVNKTDKFITKTAQKITKEGAEKSRAVKIGDFILSNSMSFGRPYILKIDGCIHDGWLLMTDFSNEIDKDFLFEILSYEDTQKQFSFSAAGGVVKNLNIDRAKTTKIPIPPKDVQKQIIDAIVEFDKNKNELLKILSVQEYEIIIKEKKNDIMRSFL